MAIIHSISNMNSHPALDDIFQHEKCSGFSESQKQEVKKAYDLAVGLHIGQTRHNGAPYIRHIDRSIWIYLNETLYPSELCKSEYLIALILHDCVEDHPNGLQKIADTGFDIHIILDILWMSEPTPSVITQVEKIKESNPFVWGEILRNGFLDLYSNIGKNNAEKFALQLTESDHLTSAMCTSLKALWFHFFADMYLAQSTPEDQQEIYAEFIFLCMIAGMPRELFRIKATERRDNMRDIDGLLRPDKVKSARKTMKTTTQIYVPRAREIWDDQLVEWLITDTTREFARFVDAWLIKPSKTIST